MERFLYTHCFLQDQAQTKFENTALEGRAMRRITPLNPRRKGNVPQTLSLQNARDLLSNLV